MRPAIHLWLCPQSQARSTARLGIHSHQGARQNLGQQRGHHDGSQRGGSGHQHRQGNIAVCNVGGHVGGLQSTTVLGHKGAGCCLRHAIGMSECFCRFQTVLLCRELHFLSPSGNRFSHFSLQLVLHRLSSTSTHQKLHTSQAALTCPPGQQETRMSPVARAGDRFSVCKDRQGLMKGPTPKRLHPAPEDSEAACCRACCRGWMGCILSNATARQPPTSPWQWPTPGVA